MLGIIVGGFIPSAPRYVNENIPSPPAIAGRATGFLRLTALFKIAVGVKELGMASDHGERMLIRERQRGLHS